MKNTLCCLALAALALSGFSCAPVYARATFKVAGEYSPEKDKETARQFLERQVKGDGLASEAQKVRLYKNSLPPGVKSSDNTVASEDPRLELLGELSVYPQGAMAFADYKGTGRKVACYPQVPLTWVTLGIWGLVPLFYPCWTENWDEAKWIQQTKLAAAHMGGNLVVIVGQGQQKFVFRGSPGYFDSLKPSESDPAQKAERKSTAL